MEGGRGELCLPCPGISDHYLFKVVMDEGRSIIVVESRRPNAGSVCVWVHPSNLQQWGFGFLEVFLFDRVNFNKPSYVLGHSH